MAIRSSPHLLAAKLIIEQHSDLYKGFTIKQNRLSILEKELSFFNGQADKHLQYIEKTQEKESLEEQIQYDQHLLVLFSDAWNALSDQEQLVLDTMLRQGLTREAAIFKLCETLNRGETTIRRYYENALTHISHFFQMCSLLPR